MLSIMGSHICITYQKGDPIFNVYDNELIKFTFVSFKMAEKSLNEYSCEKSKHTLYSTSNHGIIMLDETFKS